MASPTYIPTIGLEIHAELKTATKMFCDSRNDPDETHPNVNVCPVCMGFPGTLPVANHDAIKHVLRVGVAVGGTLADYTEFDRKNYFYPDLPKGYQISQYEFPLVVGGELAGVKITRVHLEEDTARSQHGVSGSSLIDFNRSGVPLMELVTEPVIHDATTASTFARELQTLVRHLGAGEANMEKGQMRVEANVSVMKTDTADGRGLNADGTPKLGTKVEVKNLNSFRSVERAIAFEVKRHIDLIERGGAVVQETRGWDEVKEETFSQRLKESSHDYRYFPEPDIPKFTLSRITEFSRENITKSLPELPWVRRSRYISAGVRSEDAEVFVSDVDYARIGDEILLSTEDPKIVQSSVNLLLTDVRGQNPSLEGLQRITGASLKALSALRTSGTVSSAAAKTILSVLLQEGGDPGEIASKKGLTQVSDKGTLKEIVKEIIVQNEGVVSEIRSGKENALKFLVGEGMKRSKGTANPGELEKIFREVILS